MHFKLSAIGNIGKDAETIRTESGAILTKFSIAINEKRNNQEATHWLDCVLFGREGQPHPVSQYIRKGDKIYVEGKPEARGWITKQGEVKASMSIIVNAYELLGGGQQQPSQGAYQAPAPQAYQQAPAPQQYAQPPAGGYAPQQPTQQPAPAPYHAPKF